MDNVKEVTIYCGSKTKIIDIDFGNYDNTIDIIKRKFKVPYQFLLKVMSGKGKEIDIDDDEDLIRFKDCTMFIVRPLDNVEKSTTVFHHQPGHPELAVCTPPPPPYEQSLITDQQPQTKVKVKSTECENKTLLVKFEGKNKKISVDLGCLRSTRNAIRQKFNLDGDFQRDYQLLAKTKGDGDYFDIDEDDDLASLNEDCIILVERQCTDQRSQTTEPGPLRSSHLQVHTKPAEVKILPVTFEGKRKSVGCDMESVRSTMGAIREKFKLIGDFTLRAQTGTDDYRDIEDESDLHDLNAADGLLIERTLGGANTAQQFPQATAPNSISAQTMISKKMQDNDNSKQAATECDTKTLLVKFEGKNKKISVDLGCLRSTRNAIRQKFNLDGDFQRDYQLLAKTKGDGDYVDIDDDDELGSLGENDVILVERRSTNEQGPGDGSKQLVPSASQEVALQLQANTVTIKGHAYRIDDQPPDNSIIVIDETKDLSTNFDIQGLVNKTDVVADCLRLARYGVAGHRDLQESVGTLLSQVAEMSQKTNSAVIHFRMKAGDILNDLMSAVGFLQDGLEDVAMESFENVRTNSAFLKQKSVSLKEHIAAEKLKIKAVLEEIIRRSRQQDGDDQILENRKAELKRQVQVARKDTEDSDARLEKIGEEIEIDKARVKAAMDKDGCSHGCRRGVCCHGNCLCRPWRLECCYRCCSGGLLCYHSHRRYSWYWSHLNSCHDDRASKERHVNAEKELQKKTEKDRLQELEERKKLRELENKANEELLKFIESMKEINSADKPEDLSARALRGAESAIQTLQMSIESTVNFWETLNQQCDSIISRGSVMGHLEKAQTEEKRKEFWGSKTFKMQAVMYYAKWVALRHMCEAFHRNMKVAENNIQMSIADIPSVAEAKEKIPTLIKDLEKKLQDAKKAQESNVADEEREASEIQTRMAGTGNKAITAEST